MYEDLGRFLTQQLYPDLKNWIPVLFRRSKIRLDKLNAPIYESPSALLDALKSKQVSPDSWVTLVCKPSMFGPFLRDHFITPIVGHHTSMRLGPPLVAANPIMAIMAQATSHLKPVGMYPPIDDGLYQICLYPSDAQTCGMVGLIPGVNDLVEYMPAISNGANLTSCGMSCNACGIIRQVAPKLLTDLGVPIEKYEELRQAGAIWFLDVSEDQAEIRPRGDAVTTEMWGGLYASGHIEAREGKLQIELLVEGMVESIRKAGFEPHVMQNQVKGREITVYARGIRAVIEIERPFYSIHMDAELALDYRACKQRFSSVCQGYLNTITKVAKDCGVDLTNPNDLDFSYTDSSKAYSVLKSLGSEHMADPLAIAIRDWHRKRGT